MTAEETPGSSGGSTGLMNMQEQQEFLKLCDEEFKDRYTENDSEFESFKKQPQKGPPIMDPWYNKPRRNFEWSQRGRYGCYEGQGNQSQWRNRNDNRYGHQQRYGDKFYSPRYKPY